MVTSPAADGSTISALAREAGVNVETIRYYERIGLLPRPAKPAGGRRRYGEDAARRLAFVKRAQQLGFTLAEIRELLSLRQSISPGACARVSKKAAAKLEQIQAKIRDLEAMCAVLAELQATCPGEAPAQQCPILSALDAPSRGPSTLVARSR